jgi:pyridoxal phosphate enzyme (YggS family)
VLQTIEAAARRVGRDPGSVRLVAITKGHPIEVARAAVAAGLTTLGENRVQEAAAKIPLVPAATWHLVGPLQSNKARRAVELFEVVESVDSLELAQRLDRLARQLRADRPLPVLLQVNVDADPAKAGFTPDEAERDLDAVLGLEAIHVDGLMTVGRLVPTAEAARSTFRALRALGERLRNRRPALGPELSMGMTDDYPVAVEEGATIVRIGRALFGERPGR